MPRLVVRDGRGTGWLLAVAGAVQAALHGTVARADEGWPVPSPEWLERPVGGGLAILPMVTWWLLVVCWTATSDWLTRDSSKRNLQPNLWGALSTFPFFVTAIIAWVVPSALAGQALMLLGWLVPLFVYAAKRNPKVPESEKILTGGHARRALAGFLGRFGIQIDVGDEPADALPAITLLPAGGKDEAENKARAEAAAATPGLEEAKKLIQQAVAARASTLLLEWGPAVVNVRNEVDGVWMPPRVFKSRGGRRSPEVWVDAPPLERPVADAVATTLKVLAGHEPKERRGQLTGTFAVQSDGKPRNCRLTVRSAQGGEQMLVQIDSAALLFKGYDDLGVPKPIAARVSELLTLEKGVLLVSSPRGNGLSTSFDVVVLSCDRLLRDFISIEDAAAPAREIQNVKPVRYDARSGTTPVGVLEQAMREYPRGIVTRDLTDKDLAIKLLELADDQQMVIISLRANDAVDAVARLLAAGVPQDLLARTLLGSLSQRLVRKLCPKCREQFVPQPDLLAKLKKTAEELPFLQKPSEHGCRLCAGSAYFGRTAIFELASGPTLRQAIAKKADPAVLRQAAAKDGLRPMRDEGLRLVLENVTGLEELQRVFATKS